jgi:putative transposase
MNPKDKITKLNRNKLSWMFEQPLEIKVSMLEQHLTICQLVINQILDEEVARLCGERYSHNKPNEGRYYRYGFNPGSTRIGENKLKIDVPRVFNSENKKFQTLETYNELKKLEEPDDFVINGVLHGLSTRDYKQVINYLEEGFGLSKSSVSKRFIEATEEKLKEFEQRDLSQYDFVAMFIDGKYLAKQQMIIAMGVTLQGEKLMLGVLQTTTENSQAIGSLFEELKNRGLRYDDGLLFVVDGSKGLRKAVENSFGEYAIIQRCIWHKRENILSYMPQHTHEDIKRKYHRALNQPSYNAAKKALLDLAEELKKMNRHAANSLLEGIEEILTLHKLELSDDFSTSFNTTNCIESVNSQLKKHIGRVTRWSNSDQRYRWVATSLLIIEQRLRKVNNFANLKKMKTSIAKYVETRTNKDPHLISTKKRT